jgi:hypothetical protein
MPGPAHSRSDYPTLVLKAARNCETIRVAIRCLGTIGASTYVDNSKQKSIHLHARVRIAGEIQTVATLVRQAIDLQPGPERTSEQRTQRLREMACLDQLLAAQETLNVELARLLGTVPPND